MTETITSEQYKQILKDEKGKKKPKYHNRKTMVDNITFDSYHEAKRYCELKTMLQCDQIQDLQMQVKFELLPKINKQKAIKYIADFVYVEDGKQVVEDCKGMQTQVYKIKAKLFYSTYGFEIKIV